MRAFLPSLLFLILAQPLFSYSDFEVNDLLESVETRTNKTVLFNQTAGNSTQVSKVTLGYFTSTDCTGSLAGSGYYTTPNSTALTIATNTPFGLLAPAAWNVGSTQLSIADMTTIQSIAVFLKSTNNNTPQANFSGSSPLCVAVTCASNECTSALGTQNFTLSTTTSVGDPADGGIIACKNTASSPNLYDLVALASDTSTGIAYGGSGTTTGATSNTDGATNTASIVAAIGAGSYAASACNSLSVAGGFTSGWFLPAGTGAGGGQLDCLYTNQASIGGFAASNYSSSSEVSSTNSYRISFTNGLYVSTAKTSNLRVRCVRSYTP